MVGRDRFLMHNSFYEPVKDLSLEEKGMLFDAVFKYQISGELPDISPALNMAFSYMKVQFDRDLRQYKAVCKRNRENGEKGGRKRKDPEEAQKPSELNGNPENPKEAKKPSGLNGNPENPVGADNDMIRYDYDLKESKKKTRKRFSPPTLDQVKDYFTVNGYSEYTAEKAYKYYSEEDWRDSTGKAVTSWKQKMIAVWFKPENLQVTHKPINGHEFEYDPAQKPI